MEFRVQQSNDGFLVQMVQQVVHAASGQQHTINKAYARETTAQVREDLDEWLRDKSNLALPKTVVEGPWDPKTGKPTVS